MNNNEKCVECDNPGEYWDWDNGMLISICKVHMRVSLSS